MAIINKSYEKEEDYDWDEEDEELEGILCLSSQ